MIIGSARDIVEECGVPRLLFVDFPLGNPCGEPGNVEMQAELLDQALTLLSTAVLPRTTTQSPFRWSGGDDWREMYMRVDDSNREALLTAGRERRAAQAAKRANG